MYQLSLEKFSGPLDMLLSMVEEEKLSINEISLTEVADQYIGYLKSQEMITKEELAAFLVIAATLMLIKSRSLIPSLKLTDEEETDIQELEKRLKEYKFFKELALLIRELNKKERHLFGREAYAGMQAVFLPPEKLKIAMLKKVIEELIAAIPKKDERQGEAIKKAISMEEKMMELKSRLESAMKVTFDEIKRSSKNKVEVIVSFLVALELIKQGFAIFEQSKLFGTIEFKRQQNNGGLT
ncbi:segregation/condensation protein A [Candidatus Giovannonibacteria bacterium]|nr:segregation/condensation protein A [Candidatus Giovannonibacteria bacterium]